LPHGTVTACRQSPSLTDQNDPKARRESIVKTFSSVLGRLRTFLSVAFIAAIVAYGSPGLVDAAQFSTPTPHATGAVSCYIDTITKQQTITVVPGQMSSNNFNGTLKTWSWVQYSYDGKSWYNWYGTAVEQKRIYGSGTLVPNNTWRTVPFNGVAYQIRVVQAFDWLDANGRSLLTTSPEWRVDDYYATRVITFVDPSGVDGQAISGSACSLR
jgi:hypothetical protein